MMDTDAGPITSTTTPTATTAIGNIPNAQHEFNGTANSREEEGLLDRCRHASTAIEHESAWTALVEHVRKSNSHNTSMTLAAQILLEWPYNDIYSPHIDRFLNVCGATITVSTCSILLKVLGSENPNDRITTNLPLPSILQACWATLKRLLLTKHPSDSDALFVEGTSSLDMERLVQTITLLPSIVANACLKCKVQLPMLATPSKFFVRLVDCSWSSAERAVGMDYRIALLQSLLATRKADLVSMALATHHPLPPSIADGDRVTWTVRQLTNLLTALLQYIVLSAITTTTTSSTDPESTTLSIVDAESVLKTCQILLTAVSTEQQEAVVHAIVLGSSSNTNYYSHIKDVAVCPFLIQLLDQIGILSSCLEEIAEAWSQWTFCQETPTDRQHYVTQVLLQGLTTQYQANQQDSDAALTEQDPILLSLLQGVTHRLESTIPSIRLDGMRIATAMAKQMNQELHFEELDEWETQRSPSTEHPDENTTSLPRADLKLPAEVMRISPNKTKLGKKSKELDPDADYDSEAEGNDGHPDNSSNEEGDDSTFYDDDDDDILPYDLEDGEEDLVETPTPLYLLQALELLRTSENDEHAYSHHLTALQALPGLIRKRPDDLPDAAISLLLQVLRMENKFGISNFLSLRQDSLLALVVEEPLSVGQQLIEEVFKDAGLLDRLACFDALQAGAFELSGFDKRRTIPEQGKMAKVEVSAKRSIAATLDRELTDSIQGGKILSSKTRYKRSPRVLNTTVRNQFSPIAPMWFYSLLSQFLKEKENERLWEGSIGSQLLAALIRTLTIFVECAGPISAPVLAKDLFELVWSLRHAEVVEVRTAVLVSIATTLYALSHDQIMVLILDQGKSLYQYMKNLAHNDPDSSCRMIADSISSAVADVAQSDPSALL